MMPEMPEMSGGVGAQVLGAFDDLTRDMPGAVAASAHEHLLVQLRMAAIHVPNEVFGDQCRFAFAALTRLMVHVVADPPTPEQAAECHCEVAHQFVDAWLKVVRGALGVGS